MLINKPKSVSSSQSGAPNNQQRHDHHKPAVAAAGPQTRTSSRIHPKPHALSPSVTAHETIEDAYQGVQKRSLLLGVAGCIAAGWLQQAGAPPQAAAAAAPVPFLDLAAAASDLVPANLQPDKAPDQSKYDPTVSAQCWKIDKKG